MEFKYFILWLSLPPNLIIEYVIIFGHHILYLFSWAVDWSITSVEANFFDISKCTVQLALIHFSLAPIVPKHIFVIQLRVWDKFSIRVTLIASVIYQTV